MRCWTPPSSQSSFRPGPKPIPLTSEVLIGVADSQQVKSRAWHDSLTPAQETVCRWIWETCGQHYKPWEPFEFGFLCDYNVNHELATWARIAVVFADFLKLHPSVNKRETLGELVRLSAGVAIKKFKGSRAKELTELWKQGAKD